MSNYRIRKISFSGLTYFICIIGDTPGSKMEKLMLPRFARNPFINVLNANVFPYDTPTMYVCIIHEYTPKNKVQFSCFVTRTFSKIWGAKNGIKHQFLQNS